MAARRGDGPSFWSSVTAHATRTGEAIAAEGTEMKLLRESKYRDISESNRDASSKCSWTSRDLQDGGRRVKNELFMK